MRQITSACQPSFEKYAGASRREQFLQTMRLWFPGLSWKHRSSRIIPRQAKAAIRWVSASCCASTFCSTGSTFQTPVRRTRSTILPRCGPSLESIFHSTDEDLSTGTPAGSGRRARRDQHSELPPPARSPRFMRQDSRRGEPVSGPQGHSHFYRHYRRRDDHPGTFVDQEREEGARSGGASERSEEHTSE